MGYQEIRNMRCVSFVAASESAGYNKSSDNDDNNDVHLRMIPLT